MWRDSSSNSAYSSVYRLWWRCDLCYPPVCKLDPLVCHIHISPLCWSSVPLCLYLSLSISFSLSFFLSGHIILSYLPSLCYAMRLDAMGLVGKPSPRCVLNYPWAVQWKGPMTVYFGHDTARGMQVHKSAIGIDTGSSLCQSSYLLFLILAICESIHLFIHLSINQSINWSIYISSLSIMQLFADDD